ncbi:MBL fold metallo-hydrolase [Celeribacter arenosi]|uniref:MBL fold metallo-hydrolase n=1 Tax=Celeribacter arenosi TaxID=792649 RepID=A0ABP7K6L8_9RHOB
MTHSRRTFLAGVATTGAITILPFAARADNHESDVFMDGKISVHPVAHASFVMETPSGVIYVDPVGAAADYAEFPAPDLILVTHEHGDHFSLDVLNAIAGDTPMITNPAVYDKLPEALQGQTTAIANGESMEAMGLTIDAIPAYNTTEERKNFHPLGRDNGYVLSMEGFRTYISGDTEPTPEMLALENIDLAFLCMNLPFTMDADQAAKAVNTFKPTYVYPYHYRGRDGGTQDPEYFASLVDEGTKVEFGDWYAPGELG